MAAARAPHMRDVLAADQGLVREHTRGHCFLHHTPAAAPPHAALSPPAPPPLLPGCVSPRSSGRRLRPAALAAAAAGLPPGPGVPAPRGAPARAGRGSPVRPAGGGRGAGARRVAGGPAAGARGGAGGCRAHAVPGERSRGGSLFVLHFICPLTRLLLPRGRRESDTDSASAAPRSTRGRCPRPLATTARRRRRRRWPPRRRATRPRSLAGGALLTSCTRARPCGTGGPGREGRGRAGVTGAAVAGAGPGRRAGRARRSRTCGPGTTRRRVEEGRTRAGTDRRPPAAARRRRAHGSRQQLRTGSIRRGSGGIIMDAVGVRCPPPKQVK